MSQELTYAAAGVDTAAGDRAVELMARAVSASHDKTVLGGAGGFAGLVDASVLLGYRRPLLATSTDGVGTKIAVARAVDKHDTIGQDLVAMVVDDLVAVGARPLFMTDYIACGRVVPERIATVVAGIAQACAQVRTPLIGGETAEHPGLMDPDDYDVAGAATGVVEAEEQLGPGRVEAGDVLLGLAASGLHSNGYSLVRAIVSSLGWEMSRPVPEFGRSLGEELLEPTALYTAVCLDYLQGGLGGVGEKGASRDGLHALCHVTGGGLAANLARVIPAGLVAKVERGSWPVLPVFRVLGAAGKVSAGAQEETWNMGIGMVAVVAAGAAASAREFFAQAGVKTYCLGQVESLTGEAGNGVTRVRGTKGIHAGAVDLVGQYC